MTDDNDNDNHGNCETCGAALVIVQLAAWCPQCDKDVLETLAETETWGEDQ